MIKVSDTGSIYRYQLVPMALKISD